MSGEVAEIVRGAKRKILEVRVLADKEITYEDFGSADPASLSKEQIIEKNVALRVLAIPQTASIQYCSKP